MRRVVRCLARASRPWRALGLAAVVLAASAPTLVRPVVAENKPYGRASLGHLVAAESAPAGYWLVSAGGGVFPYGRARFFGSTGALPLNRPIVGLAATPSGAGYWMVATDGGVFSFGDAAFFGSTGAIRLNRPIVGMAATPSGRGYWMVASDGGVFSFGDAGFFGSTGAIRLNRPIVGMAATPSGRGYWLVASDGGIFAFGDGPFHGSTGALALAQPITGMAAAPAGDGYWLTAADGGVFAFGAAAYRGSAPERPAAGPRSVVALVPHRAGGYWEAAASGEVLAFGDAPDLGHPATPSPIVGMAAVTAGELEADGRSGDGPAGETPAPAETTPPSGPTTATTEPTPWTPPQYFANAADVTWGSSISTVEAAKAGRVLALAEAGNMVFVGGEFTGASLPGAAPDGDPNCRPDSPMLSPPATCVMRPFLFALDATTGAVLDWDAHPDDAVLSLAVSPDGKQLYVGGRFTTIGGAPAGRLARLDIATATQDPTFQPPEANSGVHAMALHGDTLYIGGSFKRLGTAPVPNEVAALDAATGALRTDWVAPANTGGRFVGHTGTPTEDGMSGVVYDMKVSDDGRYLFVGGDFLHFGGQGGLLTLDAATGAASTWQAAMDRPRPVYGVDVWPGNGRSVIVATGGPGGTAQFFDTGGPTRPKWVGRVDGDGTDVVSTPQRVYLVGHYDHEVPNAADPCLHVVPVTCSDGTPHRKLAAFDPVTGHADPTFTAQGNTPQGPYVALVGRNHLYVGGDFTEVGPVGALRPQPGFASFPRVAGPG